MISEYLLKELMFVKNSLQEDIKPKDQMVLTPVTREFEVRG